MEQHTVARGRAVEPRTPLVPRASARDTRDEAESSFYQRVTDEPNFGADMTTREHASGQKIFGRYTLRKILGRGGMGIVWLARDEELERDVALKFLPDLIALDRALLSELKRETRRSLELTHRNIVRIHDFVHDESAGAISMEYIDGDTLSNLRAGKEAKVFQPEEIAAWTSQLCDALDYAHNHARIIHRDLKPANLMVNQKGDLKVSDFGIARSLGDSMSKLTMASGGTSGTLVYMSPQQLDGERGTHLDDIYSLGATLYDLLTSKPPFYSGNVDRQIHERVAPSMTERRKEFNLEPAFVPPLWEAAVAACLAKDPAQRPQSAAEVPQRLQLSAAPTFTVSPRSTPWSKRSAVWAGVVLLCLLAGAGFWLTRSKPEPVAVLRAEPLTTFPGEELYPSFSPDGNQIVFTMAAPKQNHTDVFVQQIGAGSPLRLTTDPGSDYNPVWSPDGRWIAFLRGDPATPLARSNREVRLIAPLGGSERKLADVRVQEVTVNPVFLAWCPDSTCVIVSDSGGEGKPDALYTVSLETGEKKELTKPQPPALADTNPSVSPDGRSLLFLRRTTWSTGEIHVLPVRSDMTPAGEPRAVPAPGLKPDNATWTKGGTEIFFSTPTFAGAGLWRMPATGGAPPLRVPFVGEDGVMPSVSATKARLVYVRSFTDENIWRLDTPGDGAIASTPPAVAIASSRADIHPQFSLDGRRVAFTSTRSGGWEIWVSDLDGANAVQLSSLHAPTGTGAPQWSPDGKNIVFASDAEGQFDIFVVPSGGGKPRNLTSNPAIDHVPTFSSDGQCVYFGSARSGQYQVWKVPLAGGEPVQVTTDGGWVSKESSDGAYQYFTATPAGGAPVPLWRVPTAGGPAIKVLDRVMNGGFAVVDRGVYYIEQTTKTSLQFFDFASRQSVTISPDLGNVAELGGFAVSPEGRTILYGRRDSSVCDLMLVENFR